MTELTKVLLRKADWVAWKERWGTVEVDFSRWNVGAVRMLWKRIG